MHYGYPHQLDNDNDGKVLLPKFHEYEYEASMHILMFKGFLMKSNIIHEDVRMKLCVLSLDLDINEDVRAYYKEVPLKGLSSHGNLVEAFNKEWEPNMDEDM